MTMISRMQFLSGGAVVFALLGVSGAVWAGQHRLRSTDDAFIDADTITVAAGAPGTVKRVRARDNSHVAAQAILVDLDPQDLRLQLDAAHASQDAAQAQSDEVRAAGGGSDGISGARRRAADSALQLATIRVTQAEIALGKATVEAPVSGYVAHRMVSEGDIVQLGQPLMALVSDRVWITANLKETQLEGVKAGDAADVTIDAFPGLRLKAHVDGLQQGAGQAFSLLPPENASGNFVKVVQRVPVKLVLDAVPANPLPVGLSARVHIHVR